MLDIDNLLGSSYEAFRFPNTQEAIWIANWYLANHLELLKKIIDTLMTNVLTVKLRFIAAIIKNVRELQARYLS